MLSDTFETGLSDHHKLILTILKSGGFKGKPKEKIYRSYRSFRLNHLTNSFYDVFENTFLKELNKHAKRKFCNTITTIL